MRVICLAVLLVFAGSAVASARPPRGGLSAQLRQAQRTAPAPAAPALRRTTLVSDPNHPFSPRELSVLQRWVDRSYIPTYGGDVVVSKGAPATGSIEHATLGANYMGAVGPGDNRPNVILQKPNRKALMHELGHVWQYYAMTDQQKAGLTKQLHGTGDFFATGGTLEPAADAYMEAAIRGPHWKKWWDLPKRVNGHETVTTAGTAYDFRAGPKRYAAIRSIFDGQ